MITLATGLGCQAFFGADEKHDAADATGGGASGGAGAASSSGQHPAGGGESGGAPSSGTGGSTPCECVTLPAADWSGPFDLHTTPPMQGPFDCGREQALQLHQADDAAPAHTCTPCGCDPPLGSKCSHNALTCFSSGNCNGGASVGGLFGENCAQVAQGVASCLVGGSQYTAGSCAATGGAAVNVVGWSATHNLCPSVDRGGCAGGASCVDGPVCVTRPGQAACPADFPEAYTAWSGAADGQGCSPCACGQASGSCTGGGFELGGGFVSCSAAGTTSPGGCVSFGGAGPAYANWNSPALAAGSCPILSGGQAFGSFEPRGRVTICCTAP